MQELIKIEKQIIGAEELNAVNARDLHSGLEIKKEFATWIKAQIQRAGLQENVDYVVLSEQVKAGKGVSTRKNYIITTDASKHIAMMSQGTKAQEVRNYFIAVEKEYKSQTSSDELSQILPVLQTLVQMMTQMMGMFQQNILESQSNHLSPSQLDEIKLAANKAGKALADCHNLTWGHAMKEVYTELNGRMGVFSYYHISPNDFDDALTLLARMAVVKNEEAISGKPVKLNIEVKL